jgi:hypothetical protein
MIIEFKNERNVRKVAIQDKYWLFRKKGHEDSL